MAALCVAAIRMWVEEYKVDGVVLVNAEHVLLNSEGEIMDNSPLAEGLAGGWGVWRGMVGGGCGQVVGGIRDGMGRGKVGV